MDKHNRPGPGGELLCTPLRVKVEGDRLNVGKDRLGTGADNRLHGCGEGEGAGEHLITRTDAQRLQAVVEGVGAALEADDLRNTEVVCQFGLQLFQLLAANEPARDKDPLQHLMKLRTELLILGGQCIEADGLRHEDMIEWGAPEINGCRL